MSNPPSVKEDTIVSEHSKSASINSDGVDGAWKFLNAHRDAHESVDSSVITALRRKIDWRIVPLMFCCYTMQFLDKVIYNVRGSKT